ncbi:dihydroneopterin aldolase [Zooshikella sp. RANM57]|uniref:dihydroneopterin aldolase n=1 Tax=Zooshikella sp. RANM57 TaxID=3425863 RepID=UPI003D6F0311
MDKVIIEQLDVSALIGVYDWERDQPQPLSIDLVLYYDLSPAMRSDSLDDSLDYAAIADAVTAFCASSKYQMLEALAGGLLKHLFATFSVEHIRLKIRKPKALRDAMAAIECERSRAALMS